MFDVIFLNLVLGVKVDGKVHIVTNASDTPVVITVPASNLGTAYVMKVGVDFFAIKI